MAFVPRMPCRFQPPRRRRVHEDVADQLRDAILDGRFAVGTKLPPERELAAEFAVNRTSIREAIKVLEGLRLVSVRQGDGATVRAVEEASFDILGPMIFHGGRVDQHLLDEMNEVIWPMLLEMSWRAIERLQPGDLPALREIRDRIADAALPTEERYAATRELIVKLSDVTQNRVWRLLARRLRDFLASDPMREARQRLRRDPGRVVAIIDAVLAAVVAGHKGRAVEELRRLMRHVGESELGMRAEPRLATGASREPAHVGT